VTSDELLSLCRRIEENTRSLDQDSQQCFQKLANAAARAMSARDLLFQENAQLFEQNNESSIRTSVRSTKVGQAKVMSYADIEAAKREREEKVAAGTGRRGYKRKDPVAGPSRSKKSRSEEIEEAAREINALGLGKYCSVF
jgi:hypothetical protein